MDLGSIILAVWLGGILSKLPFVMGYNGGSRGHASIFYILWVFWPLELLLWAMGIVKLSGGPG